MKNYVYAIDDYKRITEIYEATEEILNEYSHYHHGNFDETKVSEIQIGLHGLDAQNNIVYIGETTEELTAHQHYSLASRIDELKTLLKESDWKATVNAERFQQGEPLKYPTLAAERQAWRDEINQIEAEILALES